MPGRGWQGGSTRRWRQVRAWVLARDNYRCRVQLPGCAVAANQVHHLDGKELGDDPARLVAACRPCNLAVGKPQRNPAPQPLTRWS